MAFADLPLPQRLIAVHTDFMRHPDFALLGGVTQIGNVYVDDQLPTAGTDGRDVHYNPEFIADMSRKQLRYLVGHEAMHKALHHCTDYVDIKEKYPELFAMAVDYVVNWQLESMDTVGDFLERPTSVPPLIDDKFANKSVPEVIRMLLKDSNTTALKPQPMDTHMDGAGEGTQEEIEEGKGLRQQIEDAVAQGAIVQKRLRQMRDDSSGTSALEGFKEQRTDWRGPLRKFLQEIVEGDDLSRFSPPNKRMLPLDVIMPSHFSETTGELIVACDTSGSMGHIYPVVFGEIANIARQVQPSCVRVLWWDTKVAGEQVFTAKDYDKMKGAMQPRGGGGTTVSCVAQHIAKKRYKPKATIILTDGYIESSYETPQGSLLWGVVGNRSFQPLRGKLLHIEEF